MPKASTSATMEHQGVPQLRPSSRLRLHAIASPYLIHAGRHGRPAALSLYRFILPDDEIVDQSTKLSGGGGNDFVRAEMVARLGWTSRS